MRRTMPTGTKQTTNTSASSIRLLISPMTRDARNTIAKKGATLIGATNPQTSTSAASTHGHVANGRSRAHGRIRPKTTSQLQFRPISTPATRPSTMVDRMETTGSHAAGS